MELANHFLLKSCLKYMENSSHPKISALWHTGQPTMGRRPNPAHRLFLYSHELRIDFTFFSGFKNQKNSYY